MTIFIMNAFLQESSIFGFDKHKKNIYTECRMNIMDELMSLSPLDGRYLLQTESLRVYFSEFAYIQYRVFIEVRYLMQLSEHRMIRPLTKSEKNLLLLLAGKFSLPDARRVKIFEKETKHDIKAIEYFLKEKLESTSCRDLLPFVHFGLTSDDVNNLAYGRMLADAHKEAVLPQYRSFLRLLFRMTLRHRADGMAARTHGQPAVPTTFGKELSVYAARLKKFDAKLKKFQFEGKLNGAVGNYNALAFAFPKTHWVRFSSEFVSSLGLRPNLVTTQIVPADMVVEYGLLLYQINTILIGFCQDMWAYISRGIVKQIKNKNQIGSSTMPQKINPIYFENAEGNLQIANNLFELFARKFPVSRMQRDLSDSTVKRTVGSAVAYMLVAWKSIETGLTKITFDADAAAAEMNDHWEMLAEAMQIYFKLHGDAKGYERVKKLLMGKKLDAKTYHVLTRAYPPLANLSPATYIGLAEQLTKLALKL